MPNHKSYVIQEFLKARVGLPALLYDGPNSPIGGQKTSDSVFVELKAGESYSGNSYFNSLYLDYWNHYTCVRKFGARIDFSGSLNIRIWAVYPDGSEFCVESGVYTSDGEQFSSEIWIEHSQFDNNQKQSKPRIFVTLHANEDTTIFQISYVTDIPPVRDISLSIGLCTYKREEDLAKTLSALLEIRESCAAINEITIVNHDATFSHKNLIGNAEALGVHIIEQRNLGGCGGFNRTMFEATSAVERPSHHLLMDDDIVLDPRIIPRAVSFLTYSIPTLVLGANMFDVLKPNVLYEAGAKLDPFWHAVPLANNIDMTEPNAPNVFCNVMPADYNGWWFCIIPTNAIDEVGFSPPIFIHDDDKEYCCRLSEHGYETASIPGIALWHETWNTKNSDWLHYYDHRNRLIACSAHQETWGVPDTHYIFGFVMYLLLLHRYRSAEMCLEGLNHFLDGPDKVFSIDAADRHQTVMKMVNKTQGNRVVTDFPSNTLPFGDTYVYKIQHSIPQITYFLLRSFFGILLLPTQKKPSIIHTNKSAFPSVVGNKTYLLVDDGDHKKFLECRPNRWRLIVGTAKALAFGIRYLLTKKRVVADWQRRLPVYQSREAWERIFHQ